MRVEDLRGLGSGCRV